jgi:hypothetical protein
MAECAAKVQKRRRPIRVVGTWYGESLWNVRNCVEFCLPGCPAP